MNLILAAGTQTRWNATEERGIILPKVKQLVPVNGVPLIVDIQNKFEDSIVVTNDQEIINNSHKYFKPENSEVTLATLFSTRDFWGEWTTILLGDVLYGRNTRKLIERQKESLMFYGDRGEIYAIKFHLRMSVPIIMAIHGIVSSTDFKKKYGKLWNLYRRLNELDFRKHAIAGMFTYVRDCMDFDNKLQYLRYAKSKEIRR